MEIEILLGETNHQVRITSSECISNLSSQLDELFQHGTILQNCLME